MENFGRIDAPDGATQMWCRPHPLVLPEPKKFTRRAGPSATSRSSHQSRQKSLNPFGAKPV
jgi:hypothetical protein